MQEFPGIGRAGASIFLREGQAVWPSVAPYVDGRVLKGGQAIGLRGDAASLARLTGSNTELARLSAALVRVSLSKDGATEVRQAAQEAS